MNRLLIHTTHPGLPRNNFLRLAVAGTVLAVSVALTACEGTAGSSENTVGFYSWDNEASMKPVLGKFKKENPSIDLPIRQVHSAGRPLDNQDVIG